MKKALKVVGSMLVIAGGVGLWDLFGRPLADKLITKLETVKAP